MISEFRLRKTDAPTRVAAGAGILAAELRRCVKRRPQYSSLLVVCDRRVHALHRKLLAKSLPEAAPVLLVSATENSKSDRSLRQLLAWLQRQGADRHSLLVAVGGGVITDLVGFAASIYMRGIDYVAVATTLVGQVDAAIGGKTAINFGGAKNSIGTFYPPRMVICDQDFLTTLRESQIRDGLVEALKIFCVRSPRCWKKYTSDSVGKANVFSALIADAIRLKVEIVNRDPFERDLRRILNFGHTAGHAYEVLSGHSHGQAIAFGLHVALELSVRHAGLTAAEMSEASDAFAALYHRFDRRATHPELLWEKIKLDKKRRGAATPFVLIKSCGRHVIRDVNYREFMAAVAAVRKRFG